MTINSPAPMLLAMYCVLAERQGALTVTVTARDDSNDILKSSSRRKSSSPAAPLDAPGHRYRGVLHQSVPKWNTISGDDHHREAGPPPRRKPSRCAPTASVCAARHDAGSDVDRFDAADPFFFNAHNDLLEERWRLRAARLWAT
jgi:methylmalonyl-CoA mutase N-terminal domain/subunit